MVIGADEYKSPVGLDKLHVAEVTKDDATAYTAGDPEMLAPAGSAKVSSSVNTSVQYADDGPFDTATGEGETKVDIEVTNVPLAMAAKLTGKTLNATNGMLIHGSGGAAPEFALSFRSKKSNGKYRYIQYLKGTFSLADEEYNTMKETPEPKYVKLNYTALFTVYEFQTAAGKKERVKYTKVDEDVTESAALAAAWFEQVNVPATVGP